MDLGEGGGGGGEGALIPGICNRGTPDVHVSAHFLLVSRSLFKSTVTTGINKHEAVPFGHCS